MQPGCSGHCWLGFVLGFNPHPARRPDATAPGSVPTAGSRCFNPHPARRPDATGSCGLNRRLPHSFNPHPAFWPDATCHQYPDPERRPQGFNPHPARRPDATRQRRRRRWTPTCFNPHPARRPDATGQGQLVATGRNHRFQSSSGLLAGCNMFPYYSQNNRLTFQSSSGQKAGCNPVNVRRTRIPVSILIRPGPEVLIRPAIA